MARASRRMAARPNLPPWFETARIAAKCTPAAPAMARLLTMRPSVLNSCQIAKIERFTDSSARTNGIYQAIQVQTYLKFVLTTAPRSIAVAQRLQHACGGLHLGLAIGAALERELVAAPLRHVPVLVHMRGRPGVHDGKLTGEERQRDQRRAGERRDRMRRAEPPVVHRVSAVARDDGSRRCERVLRLGKMHDPCPGSKVGTERLARPGDQWVPRGLLTADQSLWSLGTIENEIGGEIFFHFRRYFRSRIGHSVDDRVGKAGERHARRVDVITLRTPLLGEQTCQGGARRRQWPLRRRPYRAAVKCEAEAALPLRYRDLIVEPAPEARPHAGARGLVRIERLVLADILKDFAHGGCCY